MFEKVNPSHPDKVADRIAGAITDLAYAKNDNPKIATEVLIGHGKCTIITETSECITQNEVEKIVHRIAGDMQVDFTLVPQDKHLAENQQGAIRCGDNGIFKGCRATDEQKELTSIARNIYDNYPTDGKYLIYANKITICQSNAKSEDLRKMYPNAIINPLGDWTGGTDVDTGATNRKLGSDMGDGVTGGGLHGKDLSKADVSVNIWCFLKSAERGIPHETYCSIGDEYVDGVPYAEIVETARQYINKLGGFEKFAEWGLIR